MVGFRTPDNVVYLADCLSSRETLDKYQIGFIYDVGAYLTTLEKVKKAKGQNFCASPRRTPLRTLRRWPKYNIDKVKEIAENIAARCVEPLCFETLLQKLFTDYNLTMNFEQYVLIGSTVRSYLSWLRDSNEISAFFENNQLLWRRTAQ